MIFKELDPFNSEDKFARAGRAAEEKMAFYLKRYFDDVQEILVLNGIRLQIEDDAAQVDHLIIHPHGLAIVESKSVHGKVQIKDDGQWIRWFNGNQSKGIASPITQARLQEKFFRKALGRASKNEALFSSLPIDIYVAISDDGVILWPQSGPVSGVCKSDQVPDLILAINNKRKQSAEPEILTDTNRRKIAEYLVAVNSPLRKDGAPTQASPAVTPAPEAEPTTPTNTKHQCKHCGSSEIEIRYAYSYFFFCLKCEKNSPIKEACGSCGAPAKLRKQKKEFFLECEKCQSSSLYFTNN